MQERHFRSMNYWLDIIESRRLFMWNWSLSNSDEEKTVVAAETGAGLAAVGRVSASLPSGRT